MFSADTQHLLVYNKMQRIQFCVHFSQFFFKGLTFFSGRFGQSAETPASLSRLSQSKHLHVSHTSQLLPRASTEAPDLIQLVPAHLKRGRLSNAESMKHSLINHQRITCCFCSYMGNRGAGRSIPGCVQLGCFCSFAGLDVCSHSALVKLHFFACLVP